MDGETDRVNWGVLGAAGIALTKVVPAMQESELSNVRAIASRSPEKAKVAADRLGIPKAYGSYQELLADSDIEAVYIPLPNHMHREWTVAAAKEGKHVLCEKPLATTSKDAGVMIETCADAGVLLMEAFMYRFHPRWVKIRRMIENGIIGELSAIQCFFSYHNVDSGDIRNIREYGGGALYDIGCYPINVARMLFGSEPDLVEAAIKRDERFGTDVLTSAVLDFEGRHASFTCSTQLAEDQRVTLHGESGRLVFEMPFNPSPAENTEILHFSGGASEPEIHQMDPADQYGLQADAFSRAIRDGGPVPTPPEDAVANLEVIEEIFRVASH